MWMVRIATAVALSVIAAHAGASTGNELLSACKTMIRLIDNGYKSDSANDAYDAGVCLGFTSGVRSTIFMVELPESIRSCTPTKATMSQLARVVVKFLEEHPAQLDGEQTLLTMLALKEAFPCK
jgi:hypothetical protein